MKRKDLYMGSTEIDPIRTIGEIQSYLVRMGCRAIMTNYDPKTQEPIGLHFMMHIKGSDVPFKLPARIEPIFKIVNGDGWGRDKMKDMATAKRVAWRQIYRWIQAQVALIETGMVQPEEVFMPYVQVGPDETLYQRAVASGFNQLLLPAQTQ